MQSFRTELELPTEGGSITVEKDIIELRDKISAFHNGTIDSEKFRSLRLARGVYGQRQPGVQMVRIKVPYGKLTSKQLFRLADLTDRYSTGNLHLTTRQDIQLHFVSLDDTPQLWAELEKDELTLREACGNTVRNITASSLAGIDPKEPFDVTPYADALFRYFLRHPAGQDMGRKIKIAFSSSEEDDALTFIHDIGFIPRTEIQDGKIIRGFKVLIGGGLGAQPFPAQPAFEFLPANEIIPFTEALLRVFDRHGERNNRHKARLKYLVAKLGKETLLELVRDERKALTHYTVDISTNSEELPQVPSASFTTFRVTDSSAYNEWITSNTFEQKQQDWFGVHVKIPQGNILSDKARVLAGITEKYARDLRVTIGQSFLLRFVHRSALPALYRELKAAGFTESGANAFGDITSCPGTDTCNLGISNSTGVSAALENVIREEYPQLLSDKTLSIKISGCMNSCGQHGIASIGFHGSSVKSGERVAPALQLLLGGGVTGSGEGRTGDKILKFPSKRAPHVLRTLLSDYLAGKKENDTFNDYYLSKGKDHFYQLLKPFADAQNLNEEEFIDWGQEEKYKQAIGVGECAGVKIDLVATLLDEAKEALAAAKENIGLGKYGDASWKTYNAFVHAGKARLLKKGVHVNTHQGILKDFDQHYLYTGRDGKNYAATVNAISEIRPEKEFVLSYYSEAERFLETEPETVPVQNTLQLN